MLEIAGINLPEGRGLRNPVDAQFLETAEEGELFFRLIHLLLFHLGSSESFSFVRVRTAVGSFLIKKVAGDENWAIPRGARDFLRATSRSRDTRDTREKSQISAFVGKLKISADKR